MPLTTFVLRFTNGYCSDRPTPRQIGYLWETEGSFYRPCSGVDMSQCGWRVRVSQVKPSNCFTLHPSMISKHSTVLVPDSLSAPREVSFTFHFRHKSFIVDVCETCSYPTTVLNEKNGKVRSSKGEVPRLPPTNTTLHWGSKHTLTPLTYFQGVKTPRIYASVVTIIIIIIIIVEFL